MTDRLSTEDPAESESESPINDDQLTKEKQAPVYPSQIITFLPPTWFLDMPNFSPHSPTTTSVPMFLKFPSNDSALGVSSDGLRTQIAPK